MFRILIYKEFKELIHSYKTYLTAAVVIFFYLIFPIINNVEELPTYVLVMMMQMVIAQYICDSMIEDINRGNFRFLLNINVKFSSYILPKIVISILGGVILFSIFFKILITDFTLLDFGWIFLSIINSSLLIFLLAVFLKQNEMSVTFIGTVFLGIIMVCLYNITFILWKYILCIFLFVLFYGLGRKLFNSKLLRERI